MRMFDTANQKLNIFLLPVSKTTIRQVHLGKWEYGYRRFLIRGFANTEPEAKYLLVAKMQQRAGWLVIAGGLMIGTALVMFAGLLWKACT